MKKEQVVDLPRFRLVVLGSAKCGKTSIIRRFLYNEYRDAYRETVEDMHSQNFVVKVSFCVDFLAVIWLLSRATLIRLLIRKFGQKLFMQNISAKRAYA